MSGGLHVYLNGAIVPEAQALVPVYDRGFMYGDGVFETMRAYGGKVFRLGEHLDRLRQSAALIRMNMPVDDLPKAIDSTLKACGLSDAYIRLTITRGSGAPGLDISRPSSPTVVIIARPLSLPSAAMYEHGVELRTASTVRTPGEALDPRVKGLNFLNNIMAHAEARDSGAFDAIMLNTRGQVAECTVSNIFWADNDGALHTPSESAGILMGITRRAVIDAASSIGIRVVEGLYTHADLMAASEVFVTSSTIEVLPVARVDDAVFQPGPVTRAVRDALRALIKASL